MKDCKVANQVRKERGGNYSLAEKMAIDIVQGKVESSPRVKEMVVRYMLELDLLRRKQKLGLSMMRKKAKKAEKSETVPQESTVTPELAQRLANFEKGVQ